MWLCAWHVRYVDVEVHLSRAGSAGGGGPGDGGSGCGDVPTRPGRRAAAVGGELWATCED